MFKTKKHYVDQKNVYNLPPCTRDGRWAIAKDVTRFYTCTKNGNEYDQVVYQCAQGKQYCPILRDCSREPVKRVHKVTFLKINIFITKLNDQ